MTSTFKNKKKKKKMSKLVDEIMNLAAKLTPDQIKTNIEKDISLLETELPSDNASNTEVVEFVAKNIKVSLEDRIRGFGVERAELELWKARFSAMPKPQGEKEEEAYKQSMELLSAKERLLNLKEKETEVINRFIDIIRTIYN